MSLDILLGLQWGDEGKGKIVDLLAPRYQIVARFQGGPNAGHTLYVNGKKQVLHTIPSGIVHENVTNIIGSGMVIDPITLQTEIENLQSEGLFHKDRLLISKNAHLILPTHQALDKAEEEERKNNQIGSTKKGIGPCYSDKAARRGFRIGNIFDQAFEKEINELITAHNKELPESKKPSNSLMADWMASIRFLKQLQLINTEDYLNNQLKQNKAILAEGAQGTLLDLDHGSYPFVTSSNTIAANACLGLGVAPSHVKDVYGVFKSYMTRVGSGPFPTELSGKEGEQLQDLGGEYGATTGRRRRCGWLDLPALNYAIDINGVTQLIVTKSDVLAQLPNPKFCDHFLSKNDEQLKYPEVMRTPEATGVYKPFTTPPIPQTSESESSICWNPFKKELENLTNKPIRILSTGPEREAFKEF